MLKYHVTGKGEETLLLITGAGLSKWMWEDQMILPYRLITFDLPGHGENINHKFESIAKVSEQIIEIVEAEALDKVHMMGHSIGGQIILHMLQNNHDMIDKAIIISGYNYPAEVNKILYKWLIHVSKPLLKYHWFVKLQAKALELPMKHFDDFKKDAMDIDNESILNMVIENQKFSFDVSTKEGHQVLILVGDKEMKKMKVSGYKNQEVLKGSTLRFMPAGHGIPFVLSEQLNSIVQSFIE